MTFGNSLLGYIIAMYLKYFISQGVKRNLRNGVFWVKVVKKYQKFKNCVFVVLFRHVVCSPNNQGLKQLNFGCQKNMQLEV